MTDKAIDNAKALKMQALKEIQRLEEEARVWRDKVAVADQFIEQWNAFASGDAVNGMNSVPTDENKPEPRRAIRNSPKELVAEAARDFILERMAPVSRDELFEFLTQRRDLIIEGKDPRMVLSTMLWRMKDRVVRVKGGGYWLAEMPNEAADYDPNETSDFKNLLNQPVAEILDPDSEEYKDASDNAG